MPSPRRCLRPAMSWPLRGEHAPHRAALSTHSHPAVRASDAEFVAQAIHLIIGYTVVDRRGRKRAKAIAARLLPDALGGLAQRAPYQLRCHGSGSAPLPMGELLHGVEDWLFYIESSSHVSMLHQMQ